MSANHQATAYIPWDDHTDWEDVAAAAVSWVEDRCNQEGTEGLLVTNDKSGAAATPSLRAFKDRHTHTTPGSRKRTLRHVPVLSYVPDIKGLYVALDLGHRSSVCVVESHMFRLDGWAAATAATNLVTGEATPPLDDELLGELRALHHAGNNGWADSPGKRDAERILDGLRGAIPASDAPDMITGWMLANGTFDTGAKRLHKMVKQRIPE